MYSNNKKNWNDKNKILEKRQYIKRRFKGSKQNTIIIIIMELTDLRFELNNNTEH